MRWFYVIVVLLVAAATLIFGLQNLEVVSVDFLWISMSAPLAFVVAAVYVAGMVTGGSFLGMLRTSVRSARLTRFESLILAVTAAVVTVIVIAVIER